MSMPKPALEQRKDLERALKGANDSQPAKQIFIHVKSGGLYEFVFACLKEDDNTPMISYRSLDSGVIWVRPEVEFREKFVALEAVRQISTQLAALFRTYKIRTSGSAVDIENSMTGLTTLFKFESHGQQDMFTVLQAMAYLYGVFYRDNPAATNS